MSLTMLLQSKTGSTYCTLRTLDPKLTPCRIVLRTQLFVVRCLLLKHNRLHELTTCNSSSVDSSVPGSVILPEMIVEWVKHKISSANAVKPPVIARQCFLVKCERGILVDALYIWLSRGFGFSLSVSWGSPCFVLCLLLMGR